MADESSYLQRGTRFERIMRLFNLLEPGRMVVSISKTAMWLTLLTSLFVLVLVAASAPQHLIAAGSAITAINTVVFGNYVYRRYRQAKDQPAKQ